MSDLAEARQAEALQNIAQRLEQIEMLLASSEENGEALAENVYTSNLIAYLAIVETRKASDESYRRLEDLIKQRLGLADA